MTDLHRSRLAAFSLGALIAENPPLLREVENLVGNGFRGLELPRGVRVRARGLIAQIRKGGQGETIGALHGTKAAVFETLPAFSDTEKASTVRVAELADAVSTPGPGAEDGGSNPSANDSPEIV